MIKSIWIYVIAAAVLGAGGYFYYVHQQSVVVMPVPSQPTPTIVVVPSPSTDDLNKRRQEGIGSIRSLKPVPLAPSSQASSLK